MKKFERLTTYIIKIKSNSFQEWIKDPLKSNVDRSDSLITGYNSFGELITAFEEDVYAFERENPDYRLNRYGNILEQNGLRWDKVSMENAVVSELDAQCVLALILGAIRADRFCDGALLQFFRSGAILRWLERLAEIDDPE